MEFSDGHLVEEVMGGSTVAFERLMTRYERLVFKIAFSCSGQYDSALDILQNVFLKVHRKLAGFRTDGDFKNWIAKIAVNESINWKRSRNAFRPMHWTSRCRWPQLRCRKGRLAIARHGKW